MQKIALRKILLFLLVASMCSGCKYEKQGISQFDWADYQQRFIMEDGRVVDTGNNDISHSEGQGYGLLLALAANNRQEFLKIWNWTRNNLQIREDHLFMWRRQPSIPIEKEDKNNATDGDILIAWALLQAYERWQIDEYNTTALEILSDIKKKLVRHWQSYSILLAGEQGFEQDGQFTINLSHWIFPAFTNFSRHDDSPVWNELNDSGAMLLEKARYGRWGLPPDWLLLSENINIDPTKEPVFGYNAVRIPLYLIWGKRGNKENLTSFLAFWNHYPEFIPAWTNLKIDCIDSYSASQGVASINALARHSLKKPKPFTPPPSLSEPDYYSETLSLLSQLVASETK